MNVFKTIALVGFAVLLILSALLLQINITLNGAVLSEPFFNSTFDRNIKPESIEQYVASITDNVEAFMPLSQQEKKDLKAGKASPELKKKVSQYKSLMKEAVNTEWLKSEAPTLVKGAFAYFTGSDEALPSINIKPLKSVLVNVFSGQITANSGLGLAEFNAMVSQIELASGGILVKGKVNEKAVDLFMQIGQTTSMSMKRDTARKILLKIGSRKGDGSDSQALYDYTIKELVGGTLGTDKMKNELDLNRLVTEAYRSEDNPISGFRAMLKGIRSDLFLLSLITVLLLLSIIAIIAFKRKSILRWIGVPLIITGALYLAMPLFSIPLNDLIVKQFSAQADLLFVQNWLLSYTGGITIFILVQSAVTIILGAGLLAGANYIGKGRRTGRASTGRKSNFTVCRVGAVLVLLAAIPFSVYIFGRSISKHAQEFDSILKISATQKGTPNIDKALGRVLGVDIFGGLGK